MEYIYRLLEKGFNVEDGLELCAGDEELYLEVLKTALEEGDQKTRLIAEYAQAQDYEHYCVEVHGLKNAARHMGADRLSDLAREQEETLRRRSPAEIREGAAILLEEYEWVLKAIAQALGM